MDDYWLFYRRQIVLESFLLYTLIRITSFETWKRKADGESVHYDDVIVSDDESGNQNGYIRSFLRQGGQRVCFLGKLSTELADHYFPNRIRIKPMITKTVPRKNVSHARLNIPNLQYAAPYPFPR
jgi:hypothetical protein